MFASLIIQTVCNSSSLAGEPSPEYKPATQDYGTVHAVWKYGGGSQLKAPPGAILVAADISFPTPTGDKFDLDDIDIFDADTGENYGSGPDIQRLTPNGDFVAEDDPEIKDRTDYRGIFVWQVPASVKRVNFGYWGDMLFVKPFSLAKTGRRIPESSIEAEAAEYSGPVNPKYDRYLVLLHARNWFRTRVPSSYHLYATSASEDRRVCDWEAWIEIDSDNVPINTPILKRAYVSTNRTFLVEYWCPSHVRPDKLDLFGTRFELPAISKLDLPVDTIKKISDGHKNPHALHRLK